MKRILIVLAAAGAALTLVLLTLREGSRGRVVQPAATATSRAPDLLVAPAVAPGAEEHTAPTRVALAASQPEEIAPTPSAVAAASRREGARAKLVLTPLLGGRIEGRLAGMEARDLQGSVVMLADAEGLVTFGDARTAAVSVDAERTFRFDGVPPGEYRLVFDGPAHQPALEACRVRPGSTTKVDVRLRSGAAASGCVLDAAGNPLAGVRVAGARSGRVVTSGSRGAFELLGLPPGIVVLRLAREDFLDTEVELGEVADGERITALELRLVAARVLTGRIVWPDGAPARATLSWAQEDASSTATSATVTTDASGAFRIPGLGLAPVSLGVEGWPREDVAAGRADVGRKTGERGYALAEHVPPDTRDLVIVLQPPQRLEGHVRGDDGTAPGSYRVKARRVVQRNGRRVKRDLVSVEGAHADGYFVLEDLIPGRWELDVFADGYGPAQGRQVLVPAPAPIEIVLRRRER
jgi:hypothetical protein